MDVLPRAEYERHTRAMRVLGGDVYENVPADAAQPHVAATVTATLEANVSIDALIPWVRFGNVPGACVMLTSMSGKIHACVLIRGELP